MPYKSGEIEEELEAGKRAVKILGGEVEQVEKFTLPGGGCKPIPDSHPENEGYFR